MTIEDIITRIDQIKPTKSEVEGFIEDKEYADYVFNAYSIKVGVIDNKLTLIENLILNTSFNKIDFAGIVFNNSLQLITVNDKDLIAFAMFQENYLCLNNRMDRFYYVDFYDPNNKPIVVQCDLVQSRLIESFLYLIELDINFTYRDRAIEPKEIETLSRIAGGAEYKSFFDIVISMYIENEPK
jgi:hypothetical protein